MSDRGMMWLMWAGAFALTITLSIMSSCSRREGKKALFAILAVVCIIPFPIFAHETFLIPAWMIPVMFVFQ